LILFLIQRIRAIISYTNSQAIKGTKKLNSSKLFEIATTLNPFVEYDSDEVNALIESATKIAKSWSGSWLGYHSRVYYELTYRIASVIKNPIPIPIYLIVLSFYLCDLFERMLMSK
jgi:hypothetical protein